ncbi:unnamed protein product [Rotaria sordida]|uniref:RING-type domain-containing protein n=1 Tax=Rotaria sordida TaxID=392033 RepID=A0A819M7K0_9BILA|nr:unnamed protein product [Rotaria sordida]CAF3975726.1 unnamed protein product [Rotaria sordida]
MSTELNNSSQSNSGVGRLFNNVANSYIHSDSINAASRTTTSVDNDNRQSSTWVDILTQLDHAFSGSLLRVCYNIIDIILVFLGLYYGTKTCSMSNAFVIISICILIFDGITLFITFLCFIRNWSLHRMTLSEATNSNQYRQGSTLRSIFHFLKFISVCVGTIYVFTSKIPINNNCELIRFYLGIVCFSTWILIFISPPKPSLPVRRSLIMECLILALLIIVNIIYLCIVTFVTIKTKKSECIYTRIEDLYFHAPLKSFAYVGLILAGSSICTNISGAIINQLFYRRTNLRRFFIYLSAIHYVISYTITVAIVYYYSVGAILLFQPRSGGSCSRVAPNLYTTLWIWQIIRILFPLIIWPLTLIVCCLGVTLGACLTYCLPASITVPLFTMLSDRLINITSAPNENPPASPGTIDALPMVIFGQTSDEFNQAECTICRTDYKANEKVKKLPCGHIFHDSCVAQWLSITGICPVCRHRIPSAHL